MAEQQDQTEVEASHGLVPESELPVDPDGQDARGSEGGEPVAQKAARSEGFDEMDGYHGRRVVLNGKLLLC